jgi:hypothetical protein
LITERGVHSGTLRFDAAQLVQNDRLVGVLSEVEVAITWRLRGPPHSAQMRVSGHAGVAWFGPEAHGDQQFAVVAVQRRADGRFILRLFRCQADMEGRAVFPPMIADFDFSVLVDTRGYFAEFTRDPPPDLRRCGLGHLQGALASTRARQLLKRLLDPVQREQFTLSRRFDVVDRHGRRYRLGSGRIEWNGGSFCFRPIEPLEPEDVLIAQLLYLRSPDADLPRAAGATYTTHTLL